MEVTSKARNRGKKYTPHVSIRQKTPGARSEHVPQKTGMGARKLKGLSFSGEIKGECESHIHTTAEQRASAREAKGEKPAS